MEFNENGTPVLRGDDAYPWHTELGRAEAIHPSAAAAWDWAACELAAFAPGAAEVAVSHWTAGAGPAGGEWTPETTLGLRDGVVVEFATQKKS